MKHQKSTRSFASRWGFILASVGSAVGMANVWGFPNKLGSNGGGAFLLIYLLFVFIFSYVGLPAEFAMGRQVHLFQRSPELGLGSIGLCHAQVCFHRALENGGIVGHQRQGTQALGPLQLFHRHTAQRHAAGAFC